MRSRKWAGGVVLLLIAAGLGVSYYLFHRGNRLSAGQAGSDFCNAVFATSCDGTLTSEYSHVFGLSLGGWGVVYFGALGALVLGGMWLRAVFLRPALSAALLLNLAGLAVSGFLAALFMTGKVPVCPLCLVTHAINFVLFVVLLLYRGESPMAFLQDAGRGLTYLFAPGQATTAENTTRIVAFIAVALCASTLYFGLALRGVRPTPPLAGLDSAAAGTKSSGSMATKDDVVRNIVQAYLDAEVIEVPVGPNDPRIGPAGAPVQMVIFSDFECPSCKEQSRMLERIVNSFGNKVSIVAKNYPLNSACNPAIASQPHKNACTAAYAGYAAHVQGKFQTFHDMVYRLRGTPSTDQLSQIAKAIGLDVPRFLSDMGSDAAKAKVSEDVELGIKLKLIQTPTTFLNGRQLSNVTAGQLPLLVDMLVREAAQKNTPAK